LSKLKEQYGELHPITQYRFKYDLTQAELSSLLGFDLSILAAIEEEKLEPTKEQKKRIRIITGITV
jgi:ribosome-binding protein aMBF1 (putative translation factor)